MDPHEESESSASQAADRVWLLKRFMRLGVVLVAGVVVVAVLTLSWNRTAAILSSAWPMWVSNLADLVQIGGPLIAVLSWFVARSRSAVRRVASGRGSLRTLAYLSLILPIGDRERFVGEATAILADFPRPWQRLRELLSVAVAVPGLAVILRWARRRQA